MKRWLLPLLILTACSGSDDQGPIRVSVIGGPPYLVDPNREAPDQTERARELIELGLAMDPEARSETVARLIAASIHSGDGSALERFAATGELDRQNALAELNLVRLPLEREGWVDALGRYILLSQERRS